MMILCCSLSVGLSGCKCRWHRVTVSSGALSGYVKHERGLFLAVPVGDHHRVWRNQDPHLSQDSISGTFQQVSDFDAVELMTARTSRRLMDHKHELIIYAGKTVSIATNEGKFYGFPRSCIERMEMIRVNIPATIFLHSWN